MTPDGPLFDADPFGDPPPGGAGVLLVGERAALLAPDLAARGWEPVAWSPSPPAPHFCRWWWGGRRFAGAAAEVTGPPDLFLAELRGAVLDGAAVLVWFPDGVTLQPDSAPADLCQRNYLAVAAERAAGGGRLLACRAVG